MPSLFSPFFHLRFLIAVSFLLHVFLFMNQIESKRNRNPKYRRKMMIRNILWRERKKVRHSAWPVRAWTRRQRRRRCRRTDCENTSVMERTIKSRWIVAAVIACENGSRQFSLPCLAPRKMNRLEGIRRKERCQY